MTDPAMKRRLRGGGAKAAFPDGFHPFWFWNDRVDHDGIRRQIAAMQEQGIRGFFIHSRQGLGQPYLSAAYFELVAFAIQEARSRGLAPHLYDEYPYPSGAAGGAVVLANPALAATSLQARHWASAGGHIRAVLPAGRVLACTAVPVEGEKPDWEKAIDLTDDVGALLTREAYYDAAPQPYNDRRFFADSPCPVLETDLPEGRYLLICVSCVPVTTHKYWGSFPDVMNQAAVRSFVELTHERYRQRLGPLMSEVVSVFTDEVEPAPTSSVVLALEDRHGDKLPSLLVAATTESHPGHLAARRELWDTELAMFQDSFESPVAGWCSANNIRYTGEKPSMRLSQLSWMDVPGCEPGHTKAGARRSDLLQPDIRGNARATASAAYLYGKEGSLCECYHSLGWGATLQDAKLIAESLLALGIRWLVPHAFFYSTSGLRKHDAPPSFLHMPYWHLFGQLSRRVAAVRSELAESWTDAAVALVDPSAGLPDDEQLLCYAELQHRLVAAHCDFIVVDIDTLAGTAVDDGVLGVRDLSVRVLVVPPMRDPEAGLEHQLERIGAGGVPIVRLDEARGLERALAEVLAIAPPSLDVTALNGDAGAVLCTRWADGAGTVRYFMVNTARRSVELDLRGPGAMGLRPVRLGDEVLAPSVNSGPTTVLELDGFESVILAAAPTEVAEPAVKPTGRGPGGPANAVLLATEGRWTVRPLSENLLRLARWSMELVGEGTPPVEVEPAPVVNQLMCTSVPFRPAITKHFGRSPTIELAPMTVRYVTSFTSEVDAPLSLIMEKDALRGDWELFIDGSGPFRAAQFTPRQGFVPGCVGIDFPPSGTSLQTGRRARAQEQFKRMHHVVVTVRANCAEDGLRDALFVTGRFGVIAPRATTTQLPSGPGAAPVTATLVNPIGQGTVGALEACGLPYYAGAVEYSRSVRLDRSGMGEPRADVEVQVQLSPFFEDAAEIAFGAGPSRPLPWSPRRLYVPARELGKAGMTTDVRILVHTTLSRAFEGRWFDPRQHCYRPVELA